MSYALDERRPQNTEWLSCAYRGSLALYAEGYLRDRIGPTPFGVRRHERWQDGALVHRCTCIKTGTWVVVDNPKGYAAPQVIAEGRGQ